MDLPHIPSRRLVVAVMTLLAGTAPADGKMQRIRAMLLTAYEECTAPNITVSQAFPATSAMACGPPVRSDPGCGFGPGGTGQLDVVVSRRGVRVRARLTGLDARCEGERLWLTASARATTSTCAGALKCTVVDSESGFLLPAHPCMVRGGECAMGGELPVDDLPAGTIDLALYGVRVERGPDQGRIRTFEAGLRFPRGEREP